MKHPHHTHIALVAVLLVFEFVIFKGQGVTATLGSLGVSVSERYAAALAGNGAGMANLIPAVLGFIITVVIYYAITGIIILLFRKS